MSAEANTHTSPVGLNATVVAFAMLVPAWKFSDDAVGGNAVHGYRVANPPLWVGWRSGSVRLRSLLPVCCRVRDLDSYDLVRWDDPRSLGDAINRRGVRSGVQQPRGVDMSTSDADELPATASSARWVSADANTHTSPVGLNATVVAFAMLVPAWKFSDDAVGGNAVHGYRVAEPSALGLDGGQVQFGSGRCCRYVASPRTGLVRLGSLG